MRLASCIVSTLRDDYSGSRGRHIDVPPAASAPREPRDGDANDVRYRSLADMLSCGKRVSFTPESRHAVRQRKESAMCHSRHTRRDEEHRATHVSLRHSIPLLASCWAVPPAVYSCTFFSTIKLNTRS